MTLKQNVTNMPEWMAWADLAIAAGGSTNWELALMGLPSVIITVAENQSAFAKHGRIPIAQQLGKMGISISLGWHQKLTVKQLTTAISELLSTPKQR
jgi:spore coat polysaccharide biosynthesis predicted glycosyltransferase SpsG